MAMDLPSYIRSFDSENVTRAIDLAAREWGVSKGAVKDWLYGRRTPRPRWARVIVGGAKGRVTLASIYREQQ